MTDTVNITLDKLVAWEGNVRQTATDSGIEELAASIAAHGLLQSLVVRNTARANTPWSLEEAKGTPLSPARAKASKTELAAQASRTVAGTGWIPAPLRKAL